MPNIGHIKVKAARSAYHVLEHIGENKYKKLKTLYKFADTLPYRNVKMMKYNGKLQYLDFDEPKPKIKPIPIPKTPAPKKVVQTMEATLKAKDKALERIAKPDKLVIKDNDRPYKEVVIDSKTIMRVHPDRYENALQRYNQRHKQSQEQSNTKQRAGNIRPAARVKETKSETIYAY